MKKYLIIICLIFCGQKTIAQSIPIAQTGMDEILRVLELTGKIDPSNSLTARPFFYQKNFDRTDLLKLIDSTKDFEFIEKKNNAISFGLMPLSFSTKYNSHHPYGWNDGAMIMAKGIQNIISTGVYANLGPLSVQLQPEYFSSANPDYEITPGYGSTGGKKVSKFLPGQSSVRLNLGAVSLGVSTENLWWGPGQFSSLLMSNNAPGFQHITFNTRRPLKTAIGSFEWQLVMGKLKEDTSLAFENNFLKPMNPKNDTRYFNGMVISYQPKWLKGVFFGVTRAFHLYQSDLNAETGSFTSKYLPVLGGLWKAKDNANLVGAPSDQVISFFSRWIFPTYHSEVYFEYGYNDFAYNMRDFTSNQQHSSAYIIGIKKEILLSKNRLIDFNGELTQMAQMPDYLLRNAGNWYVHGQVRQGFTNENQIMGAGSGLGNNVQTTTANYIDGFKKLGIKLQRIQQDPMAIGYGSYTNLFLRTTKWSDYSIGFMGQLLTYKKLLIRAECEFVNSKNYGWVENNNQFNFYGLLNLSYLW